MVEKNPKGYSSQKLNAGAAGESQEWKILKEKKSITAWVPCSYRMEGRRNVMWRYLSEFQLGVKSAFYDC